VIEPQLLRYTPPASKQQQNLFFWILFSKLRKNTISVRDNTKKCSNPLSDLKRSIRPLSQDGRTINFCQKILKKNQNCVRNLISTLLFQIQPIIVQQKVNIGWKMQVFA